MKTSDQWLLGLNVVNLAIRHEIASDIITKTAILDKHNIIIIITLIILSLYIILLYYY